MNRREIMTLLGGAAAAWPLAARAQRERMWRISVLLPSVADDPVWQARVGAFGPVVASDTLYNTAQADGRDASISDPAVFSPASRREVGR